MKKTKVLIMGAGPAGCTASIYLSRYKVDNIMVGALPGGQALMAIDVANYPSEVSISGKVLMDKMIDNVKYWGAEYIMDNIKSIKRDGNKIIAQTNLNDIIEADTLLIATGGKHRFLGVLGENEFIGRGISYCATCDAMFFRNKTVAVIGGSDSANTASLYLADIADKVYQIYRGAELRGDVVWNEKVAKHPKINLIYNANVTEIIGENKLEKIKLDIEYNDSNEIAIDGLFIEIGSEPNLEIFEKLNLELESGFIKVGKDQSTSANGVWAAGDVSSGSNGLRQIVTALGEGAVAAESIFLYLKAK